MNNILNLIELLQEIAIYYQNQGDKYINECKTTEDDFVYSQLECKAMENYGISEGIHKAIRIIKSFK